MKTVYMYNEHWAHDNLGIRILLSVMVAICLCVGLYGVMWCTLCMRTLNTHVCDCVDKVNANPKRVQSLYKASTHIDKERIERVLVLESPHL